MAIVMDKALTGGQSLTTNLRSMSLRRLIYQTSADGRVCARVAEAALAERAHTPIRGRAELRWPWGEG